VIRALIVFFPLILLAAAGSSASEDKPFVYDLIAHLDDAEEFHCPVLTLCEVEELTDWRGPKKVPGKGCLLYSTTAFFAGDPIRQEIELWQNQRRIPLYESPADAPSLPFWTFHHREPEWVPFRTGVFQKNECKSVPVEVAAGTCEVQVFARGTPAKNKWPIMWVMVNHRQKQEQEISSSTGSLHHFYLTFPGGESLLRFCFVNDAREPTPGERDLSIDWARIIPESTIDLYVEATATPATEDLALRFLPEHLSFALRDHPDSLSPLRPESGVNRRSAAQLEIGVNGETRQALFLPGPSRIAYPLHIPPDAALEFAVTVAHGYGSTVSWGHGTVRWLWESNSGEKTILFERFFDPEHRTDERRWIPSRVGLQSLADEKGLLILETENGFPGGERIGVKLTEDRFQGIRVAHPRVYGAADLARPRPASRPDVVIISIDTLRADHVGCYGYHRNTTPHLDRLAAEGVLFEEAYSPGSWTPPAHVSLFTSLYPSTHSIVDDARRIADDHIQLGEWFRQLGYRTGGFTDGGYLRHFFGYARGFDVYRDQTVGIAGILPHALRWWQDQPPGHPRMMFIHFYDVHDPYGSAEEYQRLFHPLIGYKRFPYLFVPSLEFRGKVASGELILIDDDITHMLALYDGDLFYSDEKLGEFFATLRERDEWDSTMVVSLSDHGEEFLDHGSLYHRHSVYQELVHIPLITKFPGGKWAGTRVKGLASLVDILPTLADWLGEEPLPQWQGESLLPLMSDSPPEREAVYAETLEVFKKITPEFRLLVPVGASTGEEEPELYDARFDPGEQFNLYDVAGEWAPEEAATVREVRREFKADSVGVDEAPPVDRELEDQLRALGYVR
jgi:arylsulfatase A-like enzyme